MALVGVKKPSNRRLIYPLALITQIAHKCARKERAMQKDIMINHAGKEYCGSVPVYMPLTNKWCGGLKAALGLRHIAAWARGNKNIFGGNVTI
jgi:hypothetical protein